jgi:phosphoenolpyruvate---glycerone phosphotransferase subunit DhaK
MKKLINDPNRVASEVVEGIALAFPHLIRQVDGLQSVIRKDAPIAGKVAIVTGGGSGHEPMFVGYVGRGMATASVAGNIFTSPPPNPIYETAKAAEGGAGVLFLYGNYAGDVLNFDLASELLMEENIEVVSVQVTDDIASAPPGKSHERRGIAGNLFVFKVAGACAEEGRPLSEVAAAATHANESTRSMGVALSSCVIPASGKPIFEIDESEIELGMGIHGEPGMMRGKLPLADELARDLVSRILSDLGPRAGDELAVLVNGLGSTPASELFIVSRAVSRLLEQAGLRVCRTYVGNYSTSLEMAGCSLTLMKLDTELKRWLLAPAETPGLVQV